MPECREAESRELESRAPCPRASTPAPRPLDRLLVDTDRLLGDALVGVEGEDSLAAAAAELVPEGRIGEEAVEGVPEADGVALGGQQAGFADHVADLARGRAHHGHAARHSFDQGAAELLLPVPTRQ